MRLWEYIYLYGEDVIFQAGIAVLGYPGTWIIEMRELIKIKSYLIKNKIKD